MNVSPDKIGKYARERVLCHRCVQHTTYKPRVEERDDKRDDEAGAERGDRDFDVGHRLRCRLGRSVLKNSVGRRKGLGVTLLARPTYEDGHILDDVDVR